MLQPSHASHAEARGVERADVRFATGREAESQHLARIAGIDEPVIPEPRRGEERRRFTVELLDDLAFHGIELSTVDGFSRALEALLGDDGKHLGRLLAAIPAMRLLGQA